MRNGKRFKIGVIGCGAVADTHLAVLKRLRQPIALCDIDHDAVSQMSKKWHITEYYTDYSEMLNAENLKIVAILTPAQTHAAIAIEAIKRGVNALVEKPLTMTTDDAGRIIDLLRGSPVKLTVNYNWLSSPIVRKALSLVSGGTMGQVLGLEIECLHPRSDSMAADRNHWSHKLPGGRFGEMLSHPVYTAQAFLGDDLQLVEAVFGKRGAYPWMPSDELFVLLKNSLGLGRIYASFNAPRPANSVDVYCTKRILQIDLTNQTMLEMGPRGIGRIDSALDLLTSSSRLFTNLLTNTFRYLRYEMGEKALLLAYQSLIRSIMEGGDPIVMPDMAYNTVRLVEQINQKFEVQRGMA